MEKILEKLSSYNLLTNLIPGVIYCYFVEKIFRVNILVGDLLVAAFFYYFVGSVISRFGSIVIEPVLKSLKIVVYADYAKYAKASAQDPLIATLNETNNSYRSTVSLLFCLLITGIWKFATEFWPVMLTYTPFVLLILALVLFIFSFRKQSQYISKRVAATIDFGDKTK